MDKLLRTGKLGVNELSRSVFKRLGTSYVPLPSGDDSPSACGRDEIRLAMDPITVGSVLSGKLAVTAVVNDLAAAGAVPAAIEMTILLPPGTEESSLRRLIDEIRETAAAECVVVCGGHTEVTPAVNKPLLCACGIGKIFSANTEPEERPADTAEINTAVPISSATRPAPESGKTVNPTGCRILMTKSAGLETMAILSHEREEELLRRFPASVVRTARDAGDHLSIRREAAHALSSPGVVCLKNLSEGGLYAALWSLSEKTGCGLNVDITKVPILQEMIEIANYYDFDPYMCESAGSLLIAVREDDASALTDDIEALDIPVYDIGILTDSNDKNIVNGDEVRCLDRPQADSLRGIL